MGGGGAQPLQTATQPEAAFNTLLGAPLEKLANQHLAAQASGPQGLAEHRGNAAAIGGGVDLQ
jgi:hypothetical protein